jgi:hypothetical protein
MTDAQLGLGCDRCRGQVAPPGKRCHFCGREGPPRPHTCHARECETPVKPEMLMCLRHWRMVPRKIQRAVWAAYRPGQCDDRDVSRDWLTAADAAIGYVSQLEGRGLTPTEAKALETFQ